MYKLINYKTCGSNMKIGIVGKPSSGKSTFFKAATLAEVEIGSRPFVTIKPNTGVGYVKVDCADKDFNVQCNPREGFCLDGKRFVAVELVDVAGLIPGSHEGKGMGNQFLSDLNQADVLVHVVDISGSTNEKGEEVGAMKYDPLKDIEFLADELDMWYLEIMKKGWAKFSKRVSTENANIKKELAEQMSGLRVTEVMVDKTIRDLKLGGVHEWSEDDMKKVASGLRKLSKPMIIACNKIDIEGAEYNYNKLVEKYPDLVAIKCSSEVELALREAAKDEIISYVPGSSDFKILKEVDAKKKKGLDFIKEFLKKNNTGVQEVLDHAVFDVLKYMCVFPGGVNKLEDKDGNVLPDCFLLREGSTALDFAYAIHTDIGKNFIRAIDVRTKRVIGKEAKLKNRDVIEIIVRK